jgi:hypothetical protein
VKLKKIIQSGLDYHHENSEGYYLGEIRVHPRDMGKWLRRKGKDPKKRPMRWIDKHDGSSIVLIYDERVPRGNVEFRVEARPEPLTKFQL